MSKIKTLDTTTAKSAEEQTQGEHIGEIGYAEAHGVPPDELGDYLPGTRLPHRLTQHIAFYGFGEEIERRTGLKCFCTDIDVAIYLMKPSGEDLAGIVLVDAVYVESLITGWAAPDKKKGIKMLKLHAKALDVPHILVLGEHNIGTEEGRLPGNVMSPVSWKKMQARWVYNESFPGNGWNHTGGAKPLVDIVEDFANEIKGNIMD